MSTPREARIDDSAASITGGSAQGWWLEQATEGIRLRGSELPESFGRAA